jgi:hypothetical protein
MPVERFAWFRTEFEFQPGPNGHLTLYAFKFPEHREVLDAALKNGELSYPSALATSY